MARQAPWSVKGVDDEARQIARDAAEAAGLPIGAWIDRAILTAAMRRGATAARPATPPAPPPPQAQPPSPSRPLPPARIEAPPPQPPAAMPGQPAPPRPPEPGAGPATAHLAEGGRIEPRFGDIAGTAMRPSDAPAPQQPQPRPMPMPERGEPGRSSRLPRIAFGVLFAAALAGGSFWIYRWMEAPPAPPPPQADVTSATPAGDPKPNAPAEGAAPPPAPAASEKTTKMTALRDAARGGDPKAQYDLGVLHTRGELAPHNEKLAAEWFERAALRGFAPAQYNLGVAYQQGRGVERKPELAFFWFQSAAEQDYAAAQNALAILYAEGSGTVRNYDRAREWFSKAIQEGYTEAHHGLGLLYENGLGVKRDPALASEHYRKAAAAGSLPAADRLKAMAAAPQGASAPPPVASSVLAAPEPATAMAEPSPPAPGKPLARSGVAEVQRLLRKLNFEPGPADGIAGDRTIEAIRLYQQFAGLTVDGKPTETLLQDLRQVVGAMEAPPAAGSG